MKGFFCPNDDDVKNEDEAQKHARRCCHVALGLSFMFIFLSIIFFLRLLNVQTQKYLNDRPYISLLLISAWFIDGLALLYVGSRRDDYRRLEYELYEEGFDQRNAFVMNYLSLLSQMRYNAESSEVKFYQEDLNKVVFDAIEKTKEELGNKGVAFKLEHLSESFKFVEELVCQKRENGPGQESGLVTPNKSQFEAAFKASVEKFKAGSKEEVQVGPKTPLLGKRLSFCSGQGEGKEGQAVVGGDTRLIGGESESPNSGEGENGHFQTP